MRLPVLALVSLLLVGTTGCEDGPDRDVAGTVVRGHISTVIHGDHGFLLVPAGRIDVTIGEPITGTLPATSAADGVPHRPPEGGSFVPVGWSHNPFALPAAMGPVSTDPKPAEMALVVGSDSFPLGSPYDVPAVGGTVDAAVQVMYVAVAGVPDSVHLTAAYDGLTQTLDPRSGQLGSGAASPLYHHIEHPPPPRCPPAGWDRHGRLTALVACRVGEPARLPYLPGQGWAAAGRAWVVVPYRVAVDRVRAADGPPERWRATSLRVDATLDGREPVSVGALPGGDGPGAGRSGTLTFDGPLEGGRLELRVTAEARLVDPPDGDPRPSTLELSRRLRLP